MIELGLVTAEEIAEALSVTPARVYTLAREGVLPCVRLGRQIRFSSEQVKDWVAGGGRALSDGWRHDKEARLREIQQRSRR